MPHVVFMLRLAFDDKAYLLQQLGPEPLSLKPGDKLNLDDLPVSTIPGDLEKTDRIAFLKQDLRAVESMPQASQMIGLARAGACCLQMLIHRFPA